MEPFSGSPEELSEDIATIPRWGADKQRGRRYARRPRLARGPLKARRLLRTGKNALGHDPVFLPILLRLTPLGTSRQITDHTELVIEGFPRSGNTFTVLCLQDVAQNQLLLSSHVHHPSQLKLAVDRGVPTVLVVREPVAALSSYLTFGQHGRPADVFREYYLYHRELIPYADRVLILDFEEIISDMPAIIERINCRFSMVLPPFDQSPENVDSTVRGDRPTPPTRPSPTSSRTT